MQRQAHAGISIASAISLALTCAGCLVTNELDFEANRNRPSVKRRAPEEVSWAPSIPDPRCGSPEAIAIEADYIDDDVDQVLWVRPLLNGEPLSAVVQVPPDPAGTSRHVPPLICVKLADLSRNCNVVQLLVSDDYNVIIREPAPFDAIEVASLAWYIGPPARETPGNPARPYVSFTECLPPDGGT